VLNATEPPSARAYLFDRVLPFELEVMHARLKYWAGDPMGYLDVLYALLKKCKLQAKNSKAEGDESSLSMWLERAARMCLIIASQMIEMKACMYFHIAISELIPVCAGLHCCNETLGATVRTTYRTTTLFCHPVCRGSHLFAEWLPHTGCSALCCRGGRR
jgi:hypothetical protein